MYSPISIILSYELLLYHSIYLFNLYDYKYFPLIYGNILYILNLLYPILIDNNRYFRSKLIYSPLLYLFPSLSLWNNQYYFTSLVFANVLGLSPASDSLLPYTDGNKNVFFYYMDVVNDVFAFSCIFFCGFIENIDVNIKLLLIILWVIPIIYWKYGLKYFKFKEWEKFHIIWQILGSGLGLIASEIIRYNK